MKILKNNKLLIALLTLIFIFAVSAFGLSLINNKAFGSSTTGSAPDDPHYISSAEDLKALANYVNAGNDEQGRYYKLANDIDLSESGDGGISIGNYDRPFNGHFDGAGYKIIGLSQTSDSGLFGVIGENGSVKNLGLVDFSIVPTSAHFNLIYIGALAGINKGLIENCYLITSPNGSGSVSNQHGVAGGLIGLNTGIIDNCYNKSAVGGGSYVGGIAGLNGHEEDGTYSGKIINCYNTGEIVSNFQSSCVGGIVGKNNSESEISACFNTARLSDGYEVVGGIAGENLGTISECFNSGDIEGIATGGIAGSMGMDAYIINCYNTGFIKLGGGIAGFSEYIRIFNCYDAGSAAATENEYGIAPNAYMAAFGQFNFYNQDNYLNGSSIAHSLFTEDMCASDTLDKRMADLQNGDYFDGSSIYRKPNAWVKPNYVGGYRYYPELKIFAESGNPLVREFSKKSVRVEKSDIIEVDSWVYGDIQNNVTINHMSGMYIMVAYKLNIDTEWIFITTDLVEDTGISISFMFPETLDAGEYSVQLIFSEYGQNPNYAFYEFTVYQAELTVTADDKFALMDELDSIEYTYMIAGFKYDDKEKYNNNPLSIVTGAFEFEVLTPGGYGSYETDIKILQGTAAAVNYYFTFIDGTLTVIGDESILTEPEVTGVEFTYNGSEQGPTIVHKSDSGLYTISGNIKETNAGLYTLTISLNDGYKWSDGTNDDLVIDWEIKQADPEVPDVGVLDAKVGDLLSTVELPDGFEWIDGGKILNICGTIEYDAVYTPEDTVNYKTVSVKITVAVAQVKIVEEEEIRFVQSKEYSYTYGDLLSKLNDLLAEEKANVSGTFAFKNANEKLYAGMTSVKVVFTSDSGNEAEFDLRISVAKAQAAAPGTLPSGLTAKTGDKLSTVSLADYPGFSWKDGNIVLNEAGEIEVTAIYNPDPDNFINIEIKLTITVSEAEPEDLGLNPAQIGLIIGAIGLVVLGAILMIVFITRRRKQKQG